MSKKSVTVSVVSHGHGGMVRNLLLDLVNVSFFPCSLQEVVVTLNVPESIEFYEGIELPLRFIANSDPHGFAKNHNSALKNSCSDYFLVINPDIRMSADFNFSHFVESLLEKRGVAGPLVISPDGIVQDSARKFPTFFSSIVRNAYRIPGLSFLSRKSDLKYGVCDCEWIAGMFMVFDSSVFWAVDGFDESYYMYLEDADICRRIGDFGYGISYVKEVCVVHDARHATWSSIVHLRWHVISMFRFQFRSSVRLLRLKADRIFLAFFR